MLASRNCYLVIKYVRHGCLSLFLYYCAADGLTLAEFTDDHNEAVAHKLDRGVIIIDWRRDSEP